MIQLSYKHLPSDVNTLKHIGYEAHYKTTTFTRLQLTSRAIKQLNDQLTIAVFQ